MAGIKETKEAVSVIVPLFVILFKQFKDGVTVSDFSALMLKFQADAALQAALLEAYNGSEQVGAEIKELDSEEMLELAAHMALEALKAVKALKSA